MRPWQPGAPTALLRLTLPTHRQVAVDGEGPVQCFGDLGIEGGLDPVPVEGGDDDHHYGQDQQQAGEGPGDDFGGARHCTILLMTAWQKAGALMALISSD
ncbi:hypothetical protein D3C76_1611630 [compost metagenome]